MRRVERIRVGYGATPSEARPTAGTREPEGGFLGTEAQGERRRTVKHRLKSRSASECALLGRGTQYSLYARAARDAPGVVRVRRSKAL